MMLNRTYSVQLEILKVASNYFLACTKPFFCTLGDYPSCEMSVVGYGIVFRNGTVISKTSSQVFSIQIMLQWRPLDAPYISTFLTSANLHIQTTSRRITH